MLYLVGMQTIFSPDFYANNRNALRSKVPDDMPIVITANALLQRSADLAYPFHQDSGFWYLTGIDAPEAVLVIDGDDEYLIVPGREAIREAFDGAIDHEALSALSGIQNVYDQEEGWKQLGERIKSVDRFATLEPSAVYIEFYDMYANPARQALLQKVRSYNPDIELHDIRKDLARLRMIKQPAELAAIKSAIDITADSIREAVGGDALAGYGHEHELEAAIAYGFRRRGAAGHAFDPIVADGANAATIHYMANNGELLNNTLVVIDVGAKYAGYCADISRTYCIGEPTERQQEVFDAVADVQQYALGLLKPGVMIREYEKQVETYMGDTLLSLGLIDVADYDSIRKYYPHACSHFLGIDPHDAGDYDEPLQAGIVMTVEPGIYIREENIGVRIEDDIMITDSGYELLSTGLPAHLNASA